ncbi:hypothetical protein Rhe02_36530 [Rhizocola hellebori]|uniref:DUF11 domain-containing protein n=1 Tax=Rhizocola hellebori TaxID=1392758 RepID=A0A8J3Q9H3_9ACTN|nr:hypothetical protein [Rhizocola hellebori]GIH05586.1 hypothetical protein Rhe02_36530 [Rhizocola hellebori]
MAEDQYDLESLNSAFAQLRSDAGGHVRPPGIAAARATASRRRQARLATLAAAVVALIVVPVATLANTVPDVARPLPNASAGSSSPSQFELPSPSAEPSAEPSASPSPAHTESAAGSTGSSGNQNLAYTAIWYAGPLDGIRVELPQSHAISVPIGIKVWSRNSSKVGPVTNAKLAVDLSQIASKVDIVGVTGPCVLSGSSVQCDFGTLATGTHTESLSLRARSGAALGDAGQVTLTASGSEPSWHSKVTHGKVSVRFEDEATDFTAKASAGTGKVGDTVALKFEISNRGPRTGTYFEVQASSWAGGEVVGMSPNCQPGQVTSGCRVENLAVGATVTVEIYFKILSCLANGFAPPTTVTYVPFDPVVYGVPNSAFTITGC